MQHNHARPTRAIAAVMTVLAFGSLAACSAPTVAAPRGPSSASATSALPPTPRLSSAANFRDVAGDGNGYPTSDGRTMARGVVYRSNVLNLSDTDLATLNGLGITHVYDLRTPSEVQQTPDRVPAGAGYTDVNLLGDANVTAAMPQVSSATQAEQYMVDANRTMVSSPQARAGLKEVLTGIENADGPVIIHCTGGKDRAGFVSAMLQSIAGVSRENIMNDYMLTNERTKTQIDAQLTQIAQKQGQAAADAYAPMMGTEKQFLQAAFDEITKDYGSVTAFLTKGVGLATDDIAALKAKLTA